jgi:formylglycine-generating enzyme required for sulfatase activity
MRRVILLALVAVVSNGAEAEVAGAKIIPSKVVKDCANCPEMVIIPPGSFEMGSNLGSEDRMPVHRVTISQSFAMGKTEITQGQWKAIMDDDNPSDFKKCGDDCPVEKVSWVETQNFIKKLNAKTGKQYRLPTEAEWEYACRARVRQEYCGSDNPDDVGWYADPLDNPGEKSFAVGSKQANAFGLYDMSGNVREWVEDRWHDNYNGAPADGSAWLGDSTKRVLRGGSWKLGPRHSRTAVRGSAEPVRRDNDTGFRLVRVLP